MKIRVGGVPEHFNFPWILAIEKNLFSAIGIELEWVNCGGGTGEMTNLLRNNEIDVAVLLTEGIVTDIINGNNAKIIHTYVQSPLTWGIHVPYKSTYQKISDLKEKRIAISRYNSGSHLMAYLLAKQEAWNTKNLDFHIIKNINGAVESFNNAQTDVFLWEKFTTAPYCENKTMRRIGEIKTPWPCFSIAANTPFLEKNGVTIKNILSVLFKMIEEMNQWEKNKLINSIAKKYNLIETDVEKWLKDVIWIKNITLDEKMIDFVQNTLYELNIIPNIVNSNKICFKL